MKKIYNIEYSSDQELSEKLRKFKKITVLKIIEWGGMYRNKIKIFAKIKNPVLLFVFLFIGFTCFSQSESTFNEYLQWCENQINVDTIHVTKYANTTWLMGLLPFDGDTTKLIWVANEKDNDFPEAGIYPAYIYLDTVFVEPTYKGYLNYKKRKNVTQL